MPSFIFTPISFYIDSLSKPNSENDKKWFSAFEKNKIDALFQLGFSKREKDFSPTLTFLHLVGEEFLKSLTSRSELEIAREKVIVPLSEEDASFILESVPFCLGSEYINQEWLQGIYRDLNEEFSNQVLNYPDAISLFLAEKSQDLRVPERIFFHLVDKDKGEALEYPFAFMVTYATLDDNGKVKHLPLKYALTEYQNQREKLITLLSSLNRAADLSPLIEGFVERGELFHPLSLTSVEAYEILRLIPKIEELGIMCRIPNWWKKHQQSVNLSVNLGEKKSSLLGFETLVTMQPQLTVDGRPLTSDDIKNLLSQTEGLAWLKGKWVEVNHKTLQKLLDEMESYGGEISLRQALQMELGSDKKAVADVGPLITNGKWLKGLLQNMRNPETIRSQTPPTTFKGQLREYQQVGFTWLNHMDKLGFGVCLADDMGLGKTVQILAYLEKLRKNEKDSKVLLVVPASLLGNWEHECKKFTPSLSFQILHGKTGAMLGEQLIGDFPFLTITTYGIVTRLEALKDINWTGIILDEAQAIKNPVTKQTKAIKQLRARTKIAMTGTPIENNLTNLWSLFDFLNKGLMGTSKEFKDFAKSLEEHPEGYGKLKGLVSPFLLRRLKSDKRIISDLPDKLEEVDYINLSKKQVILYRKQVSDLENKLQDTDGIERRGLVLGTITKLKQICNHPDQFLGQETFSPKDSGKFQLLKDICETIFEKRERVLVFTQYKEITQHLADYLETIFNTPGLVLHGGTPIKKRSTLVDQFNGDDYVPFMILSVKAGGTGLNLTRANHVIHFDRWWNPAVENQATDRAYRIGQDKNVVVYKIVCKDTIEEKIDTMINSKKDLAENVIGGSGEKWITELSDKELLSMLRMS